MKPVLFCFVLSTLAAADAFSPLQSQSKASVATKSNFPTYDKTTGRAFSPLQAQSKAAVAGKSKFPTYDKTAGRWIPAENSEEPYGIER